VGGGERGSHRILLHGGRRNGGVLGGLQVSAMLTPVVVTGAPHTASVVTNTDTRTAGLRRNGNILKPPT